MKEIKWMEENLGLTLFKERMFFPLWKGDNYAILKVIDGSPTVMESHFDIDIRTALWPDYVEFTTEQFIAAVVDLHGKGYDKIYASCDTDDKKYLVAFKTQTLSENLMNKLDR